MRNPEELAAHIRLMVPSECPLSEDLVLALLGLAYCEGFRDGATDIAGVVRETVTKAFGKVRLS